MPGVSRDAHIRHFEKRFGNDLCNLDTIAVVGFHLGDEPPQRCVECLLRVKADDGGLDLPRHEEEGPPGFLHFLLECGPGAVESCPSARIGLAPQPYGAWQIRARLNQDAARRVCVRHRVLSECASQATGWLRTLPSRWAMSAQAVSSRSRRKTPWVPWYVPMASTTSSPS